MQSASTAELRGRRMQSASTAGIQGRPMQSASTPVAQPHKTRQADAGHTVTIPERGSLSPAIQT